MRILPLLWVSLIVILSNACEKHPLAGDPHPGVHETHETAPPTGDAHAAKPEKVAEVAKPVEGAKVEEAPKFFPEKK